MRVLALASAAVGALALGCLVPSPAHAMTDNATFDVIDGLERHPAVVALVIVTPPPAVSDADAPALRRAAMYCSGVLINETTVLTASHCNVVKDEQWFIDGGFTLGVTNAPDLGGDVFEWTGTQRQSDVATTYTNTLYKGGYRDDVSAQTIDHALEGVSEDDMPDLPRIGLLSEWQKDKTLKTTPVTVIGYGTKQKTIPANTGPTFPGTNQRRFADLPTIALDKQWIHQDQNLGKNAAQGGACYGDSGGPSLVETEDGTVVVGVTSTGDGPCFATNVASRVDTESAWALLRSVPELIPAP